MTKVGLPATIQSVMFSGIAMVIGRIIAAWGETAIAVQKVGIQVEAISYMTADGFAMATNSFMAQNYGAGQLERSKKGYTTALGVMALWGLLTTAVLILFPAPIFRVFITEDAVLPLGVDYLRILGYSQFFMCLEILTAGAFSAYKKPPRPPWSAFCSPPSGFPWRSFSAKRHWDSMASGGASAFLRSSRGSFWSSCLPSL